MPHSGHTPWSEVSVQNLKGVHNIHLWDSFQYETKKGHVLDTMIVFELLMYKQDWLAAISKATQRQMKPTCREKQGWHAEKDEKRGLMAFESPFHLSLALLLPFPITQSNKIPRFLKNQSTTPGLFSLNIVETCFITKYLRTIGTI